MLWKEMARATFYSTDLKKRAHQDVARDILPLIIYPQLLAFHSQALILTVSRIDILNLLIATSYYYLQMN